MAAESEPGTVRGTGGRGYGGPPGPRRQCPRGARARVCVRVWARARALRVCVCVCACACVDGCMCVCVCARACVRARARVRVRVCLRAREAHEPSLSELSQNYATLSESILVHPSLSGGEGR